MTRHDFQKSEANMANLEELLRQPTMQVALEIVKTEAYQGLPSPLPGVDYSSMVAAHGARASGWIEGIKALHSLSKKTVQQKQPSQGDMYSEAAKQRMLATGVYSEADIERMNL